MDASDYSLLSPSKENLKDIDITSKNSPILRLNSESVNIIKDTTDIFPESNESTKKGSKPLYPPKVFTKEEINNKIKDYIIIEECFWKRLPKGSHIRYLRHDGKFRTGGFVKVFNKDKTIIILETRVNGNNKTPGYMSYGVKLQDLKIIWKKLSYFNSIELTKINQDLLLFSKKINKLESENKDFKKIIGNLYNRIIALETKIG